MAELLSYEPPVSEPEVETYSLRMCRDSLNSCQMRLAWQLKVGTEVAIQVEKLKSRLAMRNRQIRDLRRELRKKS